VQFHDGPRRLRRDEIRIGDFGPAVFVRLLVAGVLGLYDKEDARGFDRGDLETIRRHLNALRDQPRLADLYEILAEHIARQTLAAPK